MVWEPLHPLMKKWTQRCTLKLWMSICGLLLLKFWKCCVDFSKGQCLRLRLSTMKCLKKGKQYSSSTESRHQFNKKCLEVRMKRRIHDIKSKPALERIVQVVWPFLPLHYRRGLYLNVSKPIRAVLKTKRTYHKLLMNVGMFVHSYIGNAVLLFVMPSELWITSAILGTYFWPTTVHTYTRVLQLQAHAYLYIQSVYLFAC